LKFEPNTDFQEAIDSTIGTVDEKCRNANQSDSGFECKSQFELRRKSGKKRTGITKLWIGLVYGGELNG
jgi:hypothetical protein